MTTSFGSRMLRNRGGVAHLAAVEQVVVAHLSALDEMGHCLFIRYTMQAALYLPIHPPSTMMASPET